MTSFEDWFNRPLAPPEVELLPEGIMETADGRYEAYCCGCGRRCELPVDLDEIPMTGYIHYGGCGPRCCP